MVNILSSYLQGEVELVGQFYLNMTTLERINVSFHSSLEPNNHIRCLCVSLTYSRRIWLWSSLVSKQLYQAAQAAAPDTENTELVVPTCSFAWTRSLVTMLSTRCIHEIWEVGEAEWIRQQFSSWIMFLRVNLAPCAGMQTDSNCYASSTYVNMKWIPHDVSAALPRWLYTPGHACSVSTVTWE